MKEYYAGKVVLVTGAATGMGETTAIEFAKHGAKVVVADWNVAEGQATVDKITAAGGEARFFQVDVSNSTLVKAMVDQTIAWFGRLDCAFNNAGIFEENSKLSDVDEEVWDRIIDINMKGVFLCMKYELPVMVAQGKGAIVNTSSVCAARILPNCAAYTASKFGVVGLTRSAAVEYGPLGVRVNAILPGAIMTPMGRRRRTQIPNVSSASSTPVRSERSRSRWSSPKRRYGSARTIPNISPATHSLSMAVMSVPPELARLLDKQAIREVMMRYCRGVDRLDAEFLRSAYWPDAWDDHGLFSGTRDDFVAWVIPFLRDSFSTVIHTIGNQLVELAGDAAYSESYFTGYAELLHEGLPHTRVSCGRYIDRFERREREWRIARRTVVSDWGRLDPLGTAPVRSTSGRRFPDDPVYRLRETYFRV